MFKNSPDTVIAFCPGLSFQCSGESCNQTLFQIQSWRNRHEQAGLGTLPAGHQVLCSKNDRYKTKGIVHEKRKEKPLSEHIQRMRKKEENVRESRTPDA